MEHITLGNLGMVTSSEGFDAAVPLFNPTEAVKLRSSETTEWLRLKQNLGMTMPASHQPALPCNGQG
eukprot:3898112-Amphidinium_carterae.2